MNIVIFAGCFFPHVHPRAFRATELAKEFTRQGHSVTVINITTIRDFDYGSYAKDEGFKIINLNINEVDLNNDSKNDLKHGFLSHKLRYFSEYFLHGRFFLQSKLILKRLEVPQDTDLLIALSTPFVCLYTVYKYIKRNGKSFVSIADSGDPFYYSKQTKRALWFKYIERNVYNTFDYLTIPTKNAIKLYSPLIDSKKIKIIPQGFNMRKVKLFDGNLLGNVKFAYAGVFYWDIRNPEFLFSYLNYLDEDFEFHIIMRYKDELVDNLLEKYQNLKKKVVLRYALNHDDLLFELSKMNFLVNIENLSNTQLPSKLIDYGISRRPIFSCNKFNFSHDKFDGFLKGDYSGSYFVDTKEYDIELLVRKFVGLYDECKSNS